MATRWAYRRPLVLPRRVQKGAPFGATKPQITTPLILQVTRRRLQHVKGFCSLLHSHFVRHRCGGCPRLYPSPDFLKGAIISSPRGEPAYLLVDCDEVVVARSRLILTYSLTHLFVSYRRLVRSGKDRNFFQLMGLRINHYPDANRAVRVIQDGQCCRIHGVPAQNIFCLDTPVSGVRSRYPTGRNASGNPTVG